MKSATVLELHRDTSDVLAWVEAGESVEISKDGSIVAIVSPPSLSKSAAPKEWPDFMARLRRIYGDKPRRGKNPIVEERETYRF